MTTEEGLYPAIAPYHTAWLQVSPLHDLYYAEFGTPRGVPALFLHGGPGSGCNIEDARVFDPRRYRLIQFDQRGCGRSRPLGSIQHNDLGELIRDIEKLRTHLAIDQWLVYGGSWGGTVALEYAKQHSGAIRTLVLRAPFLARPKDLLWFTSPTGLACAYPTAYAELCQALHASAGENLIARLYADLFDSKHVARAYQAACAWDIWEATVMGLRPRTDQDDAQRFARVARKRIYAHYCVNQFFLSNQGVIPGLEKLTQLNGTVVHGTADRVCRFEFSEQLIDEFLPGFSLQPVSDAGHGMHAPGLQQALRRALDTSVDRLVGAEQ